MHSHSSIALCSGARGLLLSVLLVCSSTSTAEQAGRGLNLTSVLLDLVVSQQADPQAALAWLDQNWDERAVPMVLDVIDLNRNHVTIAGLVSLLTTHTGEQHGFDINDWYEWMWSRPFHPHPDYARFRQRLYGLIDNAFRGYFTRPETARIRLDEVVWGGVRQDGIPPLRNPAMLAAASADYLDDGNVVFGIVVNGEARAYPKRILAWHEMFTDRIGGVSVTGVYCTLCGTVIMYRSATDGVRHDLGTSGFLYRSNKLMYDKATQSLWSSMSGRPVMGELAEQDVTLERMSVVTTNWGEWKRRHPETTVLSAHTGHSRDYAEGAAYRDYFATDALMFGVSQTDTRLRNKDEVLALLLPAHSAKPLAVSAAFLADNPIYHHRMGDVDLVIITDPSGANRVFANPGVRFAHFDGNRTLEDDSGNVWQLSESELRTEDGRSAERLPAHRAFWFGWFAAFPNTELVR